MNKNKKYTKEYLINCLKSLQKEYISKFDIDNNKNIPSSSTFKRYFGSWSNAIKEENAEEVRKRKLAIIAEYRERQLELEKAIKLEEFKRGKIQTDNIEEGRKLLIPDNLTEEEQMIVKEFYNL